VFLERTDNFVCMAEQLVPVSGSGLKTGCRWREYYERAFAARLGAERDLPTISDRFRLGDERFTVWVIVLMELASPFGGAGDDATRRNL